MLNCPECDAVLDVEENELDEGEEITCEECGVSLIVTQTEPVEFEIADEVDGYDDEYDEDDDDFDDEDEDDEDEEEEQEEEEDWR